MLNFLKKEMGKTHTQNGALTYETSESYCLDLFSKIGALRNAPEDEIQKMFLRAFLENKNLAMRILFFARDVRGGLGERKVFRTILKYQANACKKSVLKNLKNIPEYGRFDDLTVLLDTDCKKEVLTFIKEQLREDIENIETESISLLAKWLPSINASNPQTVRYAKRIAKSLSLTDKEYRQILVKLRAKIKIIENNLRQRDYTFDYSKQPSKAMFKYKKAFIKNDGERYRAYLDKVQSGEVKINIKTLYPYDIIRPILSGREISEAEKKSLDATWRAQANYTSDENAIVVADGSGSMYLSNALPAAIAQSLAIYFAQYNSGKFKNHFITFSETPQLVEIKGKDIYEKVCHCASFNEVANTNIQKVFELILKTAMKNRLSQKDMPERIYIISDMEFDICATGCEITNFEYAKDLFEEYGYRLPKVIFWNVNTLTNQVPVKQNEQGVALVSGCSPRIFEMLSKGEMSPYKFMMDTLSSKRYKMIKA